MGVMICKISVLIWFLLFLFGKINEQVVCVVVFLLLEMNLYGCLPGDSLLASRFMMLVLLVGVSLSEGFGQRKPDGFSLLCVRGFLWKYSTWNVGCFFVIVFVLLVGCKCRYRKRLSGLM